MAGGHNDGREQDAALAAFGLKADAPLADADLELWLENVSTVQIFGDLMTQWNVGPGGVVGLRYEALPLLLDVRAVPVAERADLLHGVRVMEREVLEVFRGR